MPKEPETAPISEPVMPDDAPDPYEAIASPRFFPNDPEFNEAFNQVPAETNQRLSDLLRARFKYLEIIKPEAPVKEVAEDEVIVTDELEVESDEDDTA